MAEITENIREKAREELRRGLPPADKYLVGFYIMLCIISLVELYSASSREVTSENIFGPLLRQSAMLLAGIAVCIVTSRMKLRTIIKITPIIIIISVLCMLYVMINGDVINGARRSFSLPGFRVQPAEFLKLSAVLFVAYVLSRNQEKGGVTTRGTVICAVGVIVFCGMLVKQGLTNTLLLFCISLAMMMIGGMQYKKLFVVLLCYMAIGGIFAWSKLTAEPATQDTALIMETGKDASGNSKTIDRTSTQVNRLDRYFDPTPAWEKPIDSQNQQEMYSYMAQAHGGIHGVLPGNSRETARLPLAFSDYIYSIVVEDWGFIGGVILLLIYLSLLARAGVIAYKCDRVFPAMLVAGMAVMIVLQALFHISIVTGVFPVSGQPLPMISQGGTSMIVTSFAFGIMLSISRYAERSDNIPEPIAGNTLPEELNAINPTRNN